MTPHGVASTVEPLQAAPLPWWFRTAASLGMLWNGYGAFQFGTAVSATPESLMAMGMPAAQAQLISSYPAWMTAGFAVGALGGLLGSALLLWRRRAAVPILAASFAGYILLYVGDITQGIFAALGLGQVIILSLVVAIAAGLAAIARRAANRGILA